MGVSGAVAWLAALTARPVVRGIILGLGLSFLVEGINFIQRGPLVAIPGIVLTFVLLSRPRVPAMLALLAYGSLMALSLVRPHARERNSPRMLLSPARLLVEAPLFIGQLWADRQVREEMHESNLRARPLHICDAGTDTCLVGYAIGEEPTQPCLGVEEQSTRRARGSEHCRLQGLHPSSLLGRELQAVRQLEHVKRPWKAVLARGKGQTSAQARADDALHFLYRRLHAPVRCRGRCPVAVRSVATTLSEGERARNEDTGCRNEDD